MALSTFLLLYNHHHHPSPDLCHLPEPIVCLFVRFESCHVGGLLCVGQWAEHGAWGVKSWASLWGPVVGPRRGPRGTA